MTDRKISLKSGYGKYMGVDKSGLITGRVDAITPLEQFEPVWQEIEGISKVTLLMKYVQNLIHYNFHNYVQLKFGLVHE